MNKFSKIEIWRGLKDNENENDNNSDMVENSEKNV